MAGGSDPAAEGASPAEIENTRICKYTAWTWAAVVAALLVHHWSRKLLHHVRRLASLNGAATDGRQRYFSVPDENWAFFKRHFVTAPLWRKRHNREFRLSAAVNVGTLPGRLQTLFLLGYFAMNVALCAITIDWADSKGFYDDARNRTGVLSVLNMIPLFLLAGRNNPLIGLLGISFDTSNLVHRWIGRLVVFEAIAHTAFWVAGKVALMGAAKAWPIIGAALRGSRFLYTGTIGAAAFTAILVQSPSIVRHAFYETFLHTHLVLAATATVGVWIHLAAFPPQQRLLLAAIVCWLVERSVRVYTLIRRNTGAGSTTTATVEALPGDAVRVTLRIAKPWRFQPGQHIYMYMPAVGWWTSHPFSLAWSDDGAEPSAEKGLPRSRPDVLAAGGGGGGPPRACRSSSGAAPASPTGCTGERRARPAAASPPRPWSRARTAGRASRATAPSCSSPPASASRTRCRTCATSWPGPAPARPPPAA